MASTKHMTPRGVAVRPRLDQPYKWDQDAKKVLPNPDGEFTVTLALEGNDAQRLQSVIDGAAREAGLKKPKNLPYSAEEDRETGEETGRTLFTFKQNAKRKNGTPNKIYQCDSRGKPLGSTFKLTSGSEVIIAFHPYCYTTLGGGVKLYIDGVQVAKLVERNAVAFAALEDGYEAEDEVNDSVDTGHTDDVATDF